MIGVERTEIKSSANAIRSSTDNGVAGLNMVTVAWPENVEVGRGRMRESGQRPQDAAGEGVADQHTVALPYLAEKEVRNEAEYAIVGAIVSGFDDMKGDKGAATGGAVQRSSSTS